MLSLPSNCHCCVAIVADFVSLLAVALVQILKYSFSLLLRLRFLGGCCYFGAGDQHRGVRDLSVRAMEEGSVVHGGWVG